MDAEAKTTIHEIGHWFHTPDHYDTVSGDGDIAFTLEEVSSKYTNRVFNANCIYGTEKDSALVASNFTICDGCSSFIRENADKFGGAE